MNRMSAAVIAATLMTTLPAFGQQTVDELEKEISRIRKELVQVQNERSTTKDQMKTDREEFDTYRQSVLTKMRTLRAETDSISSLQGSFKQKKASLEGAVLGYRSQQRQYDLLQEQFREKLLLATSSVEMRAKRLTPTAKEKPMAAASLLRSELSSKSVDNVEAVARLFQIARDMDGAGSTIQIVQGTSPVADIRGTAFRLRLGTLAEVVVSQKGDKAAIWTGVNEAGVDQWKVISDPAVAQEILTAVTIREGKAIPRMVKLPFANAVVYKEGSIQ